MKQIFKYLYFRFLEILLDISNAICYGFFIGIAAFMAFYTFVAIYGNLYK